MAALSGRPIDQVPAAPCYLSLYLEARIQSLYADAYRRKLAGQQRCRIDHDEDCHFRAGAILGAYRIFAEMPCWIETLPAESRTWADRGEMRLTDGHISYHDLGTGTLVDLEEPGRLMLPSSVQYAYRTSSARADVWDAPGAPVGEEQIDGAVPIRSADALEAEGVFEVTRLLAEAAGSLYFISHIVPTPFWGTYGLLGFSGMMVALRERPELFRRLMARRHVQRLELLRGHARAGLDGVWLEECLSSADLISPSDYEAFAFETTRDFIRDLGGLGLKVVLYYCGDAMPRLAWLRRLGADGLALEESKKGFRVDIGEVVDAAGDAACIFGNVDAIWMSEQATGEEIETEVHRQRRAAQSARGFVLCQGSPFPLETAPWRIDRFMAAAREASDSVSPIKGTPMR